MKIEDLPPRLPPYVVPGGLNPRVLIAQGPFQLVGPSKGTLESDLTFRWIPSTAIEFEGLYSGSADPNADGWTLVRDADDGFAAPALLLRHTLGLPPERVGGIIKEPFVIGSGPIERLRFSLVTFPSYNGAAVRFRRSAAAAEGLFTGRLSTTSPDGSVCLLDQIPEANDWLDEARGGGGFVISHVGAWLPHGRAMESSDAIAVLDMLHIWFGFLRGAWTGPVFPEGLTDTKVVWRRYSPWHLTESRPVSTWLPEHKPLDVAPAFDGFSRKWDDASWRSTIRRAVSWLVESNSIDSARESRIVLAQVALELLAGAYLVDTAKRHSKSDFQRLSAAGRIRILLQHFGISSAIPDYFTELPLLLSNEAFDGPGVITRIRNGLVHSGSVAETATGVQLYECWELALEYLSLSLLALFGHTGYYARRGWRGWKGDDEVLVPWSPLHAQTSGPPNGTSTVP